MGDLVQDMMQADAAGFAKKMAEFQAAMQENLRATFRPEFLNRIDDVITFKPRALLLCRSRTCRLAWPIVASNSK